MPDFTLELAIGAGEARRVVGIDEAGRGPWAGPVVAAAVWLDPAHLQARLASRLDDSKRLSPALREELCDAIRACAVVGIGEASVEEIDRLNILAASLLAMQRACTDLGFVPDGALVDGNKAPELPCPCRVVVGGDGASLSIAAASIVAKVVRDRKMDRLAHLHPGYGWERNRGYGTAEHRTALQRYGVTPEHRRTFRPIREILALTN